jgi:hypothetical protein
VRIRNVSPHGTVEIALTGAVVEPGAEVEVEDALGTALCVTDHFEPVTPSTSKTDAGAAKS